MIEYVFAIVFIAFIGVLVYSGWKSSHISTPE